MAVSVFKERKALVLQWDAGDYEGPTTIETVNVADIADISSTELVANPGFAAVSFPLEYEGSFTATVKDADGNVIDKGEINVD